MTEKRPQKQLMLFVGLTLGATFLLHGAIAARGLKFSLDLSSASALLYLAGLAAPAFAALVLTPPASRVAFVRAAVLTPIRFGSLALAVLTQAAILCAAWLMLFATGQAEHPLLRVELGFALVAVGQVWVVLGEELGWRGFALPRLIDAFGARTATLALAVIWGVWHAPMFLVAQSLQSQSSAWLFSASIFAWSVLHTLLYTRERPSLLANFAFHATANITLNLGLAPAQLTPFLIVSYIFCGSVVLVLLRPRSS